MLHLVVGLVDWVANERTAPIGKSPNSPFDEGSAVASCSLHHVPAGLDVADVAVVDPVVGGTVKVKACAALSEMGSVNSTLLLGWTPSFRLEA
jgi:hypothetical protein